MEKIKGKIARLLFRHPMLYFLRYALLSKNGSNKNIESIGCFNDINSMAAVPELYFEINARIPFSPGMDEFEKAIAIGRYLRENIVGGKGLGLPSEITLEEMLAGRGGVCSDFAQIFNLFCFINGIKVREWGCVDTFYKSRFGHSFNEIYSQKHKKWIAIDIHKSIVFKNKGRLLSAIELFLFLRLGKRIKFIFFSGYMPPFKDRLHMVYSKNTLPFLIDNYRNCVNDYFHRRFSKFPPVVINMLLFLSRKNYKFVFVMDNYRVKLLPRRMQKLQFIASL